MFILPNPPRKRGSKKGRKARAKKSRRSSRRSKRTRWTSVTKCRRRAASTIASSVCDPGKLARAMKRYCKIRSKYPKGLAFGRRKKKATSKLVAPGFGIPDIPGTTYTPTSGPFKAPTSLTKAPKRRGRKRRGSTRGMRWAPTSLKRGTARTFGFIERPGKGRKGRKSRRGSRRAGMSAAMRAWKRLGAKSGGTSMDYGFGVGSNPFRRYYGRGDMKRRSRRRKFGYRPSKRNPITNVLEMLSGAPPVSAGMFSGVQPRNMVAVLPILGGALLNGQIRGKWIPALTWMPNILKGGLGNYLLGIGTSGLIGAIAGYFNYGVGQSMFVGGVSETAISAFAEGWSKKSFSPLFPRMSGCEGYGCMGEDLEGMSEDLEGLALGPEDTFRMGDFTSPMQTSHALQMPSAAGQYPMPATVADYETSVLSEMIDDTM